MAIVKINHESFIEMPWKNGGGNTTEFFRISSGGNFLFRISVAQVNESGPFSQFENTDRILTLLEGNGFSLTGEFGEKTLATKTDIFNFPGEWAIECKLINGACKDLNVMTDRSYAKSSLSLQEIPPDQTSIFTCQCDLKFLYDKEDHLLYKLELNDSLAIKSTDRMKIIYAIDVVLL